MQTIKTTLKYAYPAVLFIFMAFILPVNALDLQENHAVPVKAIARVDKLKVIISEQFTYEVVVYLDKGTEIEIPNMERLGVFEIKDSGLLRIGRFGRDMLKIRYSLRSYETGEKVIPGIKINYMPPGGGWKTIECNDVNVYVESVFERSKIEPDIKSIIPPIGLKFAYTRHIITGIFLFIVVCYAGFLFLKYGKLLIEKRNKAPARIFLLYRQLCDNLDIVSKEAAPDRDGFIKLTEVIKEYLILTLKISLPMLTTEEFLSSIRANNIFFKKYGEDLSFILRVCDLVKFANHKPEMEEFKRVISLGKHITRDILPQE
jgi:hypothetical protein